MTLPADFLLHALNILPKDEANSLIPEFEDNERAVRLRRAVSASYYALFHYINQSAVNIIAPNVSVETSHRIQRWFDHAEMKKLCGRFLKDPLDQPLLGLIGPSASADMQAVCRTFITLQEARHNADYDLSDGLTAARTRQYVHSSGTAFLAWQRIAKSAEANIFVLSLLLWKNWDKERA